MMRVSVIILSLLAGIYFLFWRCWNFLYEQGFIIPKRVGATVVSVGNLTVGGTGKTPFTIFLADFYQARGYTVGIVSRGYKGNYTESAVLVSDGTTVFGSAARCGDEPIMMARRLHQIPIAVSKDRSQGCQLLIEKFKVNLILLDDGFQHRRLHRDLDVLLSDTTQQNYALFPKGRLREDVSAVSRAHVVVLTRQECKANDDPKDAHHLPWTGPTLHTSFSPVALISIQTGVSHLPSDLKGEKIFAFCGIGNPDSFLKMLTDLGADIAEAIVFRDHFNYTAEDIKKIGEKSKRLGVKFIVTTEKDAVKIESFLAPNIELLALRIEILFREPPTVWEQYFTT
jgi:tetraacyldisaccharide 4'-kinase